MWDIQGENLVYCDLAGSILDGNIRLVIKTVCLQSRHVYISTGKNVGCPLVILAGARVGGKVSAMRWSIFCQSTMGKTWGDSMPEVVASM